jgi:hypothetical protein
MKSSFCLLVLLTAPLSGFASQQIIPAGSLVQCTVSEPKLSSKTEDVGDPVLCQVSHVELYGRSVFPYGSYLVGRFEDYKDPGHLVGKGWMELKFDRMVLPPDQVLPIAAKVVYVPKYPVDKEGKIHGKGHPVRDAVEWSIPVLWPIDVLNLPRRGPRVVLKEETRLTLKIMDDLVVPGREQTEAAVPYYPPPNPPRDSYGFTQRTPMYAPQSYTPQYAAPRVPGPIAYYPQPAAPRPLTVLMLRDGNGRLAIDYWFEGGTQLRYVALNGSSIVIPLGSLDLGTTVQVNRERGVPFIIRSIAY